MIDKNERVIVSTLVLVRGRYKLSTIYMLRYVYIYDVLLQDVHGVIIPKYIIIIKFSEGFITLQKSV